MIMAVYTSAKKRNRIDLESAIAVGVVSGLVVSVLLCWLMFNYYWFLGLLAGVYLVVDLIIMPVVLGLFLRWEAGVAHFGTAFAVAFLFAVYAFIGVIATSGGQ